jgi:hypothetical protein
MGQSCREALHTPADLLGRVPQCAKKAQAIQATIPRPTQQSRQAGQGRPESVPATVKPQQGQQLPSTGPAQHNAHHRTCVPPFFTASSFSA